MKWFDPHIPEEDRFVPPKFDLGQFFFTRQTALSLVEKLDAYASPCCLCTPRLAWEWHLQGRSVRLLDCDTRFESMPGFRRFDLMRPTALTESFDAIIVDPIFVPAPILRRAVDLVSSGSHRSAMALYVTFPTDREKELLDAFSPYELRRLPFEIRHNNVKSDDRNRFGLFGSRPLI
jgi:hypothetical protein